MSERTAAPPVQPLQWALLMALTAALSLWSWSRLGGSPLADVIEYLERAQAFVRGGELIDAQPIRAIGVSLIHAPLLWLADLVGLAHTGWVLGIAGAVHIALTCLFVAATVVFTRALVREVGRPEEEVRVFGWTAGLVALCCPTLLQYAPIAMTDIPSGAALTFGWTFALFGEPTRRRAALSGVFFGLSALAAFKAIPLIAAGWLATLAIRLGTSGGRAIGFAAIQLLVIAAFALLQGFADWYTYGSFAEGLRVYVLINFGQVLAAILLNLHLDGLASDVYLAGVNALDSYPRSVLETDTAKLRALSPSTWYFDHFEWVLSRLLVPFIAAGAVAGLAWGARVRAAALARIVRVALMLTPLAIAAGFALATASKGSTDIRIWLPILPILCAYAALGLIAFAGPGGARLARPRAALAALALGVALVQSGLTLNTWQATANAAFARAARWLATLDGRLPAPAGQRPSIASSYHWAVLFRTPPAWDLVKLPHQLDGLDRIDEEGRRATLQAIARQDALILHSAMLTMAPDPEHPWRREFFDLVAREFHVAAAFWDRAVDPGFGMILVLTREVPEGDIRRPLTRISEAPAEASPAALRLQRQLGDTTEAVDLAGLRATLLPGDGIFWIEVDLDRRSPRLVARHYAIHIEARDAAGDRGFAQLRAPRWGKRDLADIPEGARLTEGMPLAPSQGPLGRNLPAEPLEGPGDVTLWFDLATSVRDEFMRPVVTGRMEPLDPVTGDHAERDDIAAGSTLSDDGFRFSPASGALHVGTLRRLDGQTALRLERPLAGQ